MIRFFLSLRLIRSYLTILDKEVTCVRCCRYRVRPSLRAVWVVLGSDLLLHGLDPNMDPRVEGERLKKGFYNLLMFASADGHIDQAITLLDHGANVNKTVVEHDGDVASPLTYTFSYGAHDICRLFLTRGAIPTTNDVDIVFRIIPVSYTHLTLPTI